MTRTLPSSCSDGRYLVIGAADGPDHPIMAWSPHQVINNGMAWDVGISSSNRAVKYPVYSVPRLTVSSCPRALQVFTVLWACGGKRSKAAASRQGSCRAAARPSVTSPASCVHHYVAAQNKQREAMPFSPISFASTTLFTEDRDLSKKMFASFTQKHVSWPNRKQFPLSLCNEVFVSQARGTGR